MLEIRFGPVESDAHPRGISGSQVLRPPLCNIAFYARKRAIRRRVER